MHGRTCFGCVRCAETCSATCHENLPFEWSWDPEFSLDLRCWLVPSGLRTVGAGIVQLVSSCRTWDMKHPAIYYTPVLRKTSVRCNQTPCFQSLLLKMRSLQTTRCHAAHSEATHTGPAVNGVWQGRIGGVKNVDPIAELSLSRVEDLKLEMLVLPCSIAAPAWIVLLILSFCGCSLSHACLRPIL